MPVANNNSNNSKNLSKQAQKTKIKKPLYIEDIPVNPNQVTTTNTIVPNITPTISNIDIPMDNTVSNEIPPPVQQTPLEVPVNLRGNYGSELHKRYLAQNANKSNNLEQPIENANKSNNLEQPIEAPALSTEQNNTENTEKFDWGEIPDYLKRGLEAFTNLWGSEEYQRIYERQLKEQERNAQNIALLMNDNTKLAAMMRQPLGRPETRVDTYQRAKEQLEQAFANSYRNNLLKLKGQEKRQEEGQEEEKEKEKDKRYQYKTILVRDPNTGATFNISAIFDPSTGNTYDAMTKQLLNPADIGNLDYFGKDTSNTFKRIKDTAKFVSKAGKFRIYTPKDDTGKVVQALSGYEQTLKEHADLLNITKEYSDDIKSLKIKDPSDVNALMKTKELRQRLAIGIQNTITQLGKAGNVGVIQPGEYARLSLIVGLEPIKEENLMQETLSILGAKAIQSFTELVQKYGNKAYQALRQSWAKLWRLQLEQNEDIQEPNVFKGLQKYLQEIRGGGLERTLKVNLGEIQKSLRSKVEDEINSQVETPHPEIAKLYAENGEPFALREDLLNYLDSLPQLPKVPSFAEDDYYRTQPKKEEPKKPKEIVVGDEIKRIKELQKNPKPTATPTGKPTGKPTATPTVKPKK
jgi:hypothetical protein